MKRKPPVNLPLPVNAFLAWTTLGIKWMEMMAASGQVIARRSRRKPTPAQWLGIANEKALAAMESSNAMARGMIGFPTKDAMAMWDAWARVLSGGLAPYHARATRNARVRRRRR